MFISCFILNFDFILYGIRVLFNIMISYYNIIVITYIVLNFGRSFIYLTCPPSTYREDDAPFPESLLLVPEVLRLLF